ncbi:COX15/CtaA family protein [Vibrio hangzhouensis]|uniref:Cytochrome c oxidase assembly protein subunit 15 n=1 Tax=Vibrio hangzhouensis TaxID=462991 RepID=A0A1H5SZY1_9VIBR|nr:COX15/CtaA family protein [Vibrio hangzhouensis]SEF56034.1 cytochrome c oxidase assembly protein subunit 15 [Vibrio hangzhouensis]
MGLINLVRTSLVLTVIVIAMGAYTRLADAGLGCPDWPGCYGHLTVPSAKVDVEVANTLYPERAVEPHKAWLEMIHRYLAGSLGIVVFAITAFALGKQRQQLGTVLPISLSLVIVFQAALGMWTVTLKLMPIVVMGHLLGGFTMFSLLFLTYLRLRPKVEVSRIEQFDTSPTHPVSQGSLKVVSNKSSHRRKGVVSQRLQIFALVALVLTVVQIILGGWTSSNYAAVVCTALPICEGNWVSYLDFKTAFTPVHFGFDNYEFGVLEYPARITIHVSHRIGAILVALVVGLLALQLLKHEQHVISRLGRIVAVVLSIQLVLGVSNVVFHLPLPVAVLHNLGAACLLLSLIQTNYVLHRVSYVGLKKPELTAIEPGISIETLKVSGDKESSL